MSTPRDHSQAASPSSSRRILFLALFLLVAVILYLLLFRDRTPPPQKVPISSNQTTAHDSIGHNPDTSTSTTFTTLIRRPTGPPRVLTGLLDHQGQPITVACNTCHTTRPPNTDLKVGMELKTFHQGLKAAHGSLTCVSCHNPDDGYKSLRLADGKTLPFPDVMQLCAQCHGPQFRDYQHGAHGGMTGYWDLTKGGRVRNNCIDCHDPHSPKYPTVRPAPGPIDKTASPKTGAPHE